MNYDSNNFLESRNYCVWKTLGYYILRRQFKLRYQKYISLAEILPSTLSTNFSLFNEIINLGQVEEKYEAT